MSEPKPNVQNAVRSLRPDLKLDWCSHEAAKYACEKWHYSHSMPTPPILRIGVWEENKFIGCVLFSRGANNNLGRPYGLDCTAVCELTRVALSAHKTAVSRILAIALRMLKSRSKGIRLCISFADANEGHIGGIYQASGWIYAGRSKSTPKYKTTDGRLLHQRQVSKTGVKPQYGVLRRVPISSECIVIPQLDKFRYLMPLDAEMRKQLLPLAKPYPKRATSIDVDAPGDQPGEGGSTPTVALQLSKNQWLKQVDQN